MSVGSRSTYRSMESMDHRMLRAGPARITLNIQQICAVFTSSYILCALAESQAGRWTVHGLYHVLQHRPMFASNLALTLVSVAYPSQQKNIQERCRYDVSFDGSDDYQPEVKLALWSAGKRRILMTVIVTNPLPSMHATWKWLSHRRVPCTIFCIDSANLCHRLILQVRIQISSCWTKLLIYH